MCYYDERHKNMISPDYGLENNTTLLTPSSYFLFPWTPTYTEYAQTQNRIN